MKVLKIFATIVVVVVVAIIWAAPIGPLPGVFIGGTETPIPAGWGDTSRIDEIRLEVGEGMIPRVVIIWVIQENGDLHVVGAKGSGWTTAIGSGGPVRMRMGGNTYNMHATLLSTGWQPILEAYVAKYQVNYPDIVQGFPEVEEAAATTSVFRLTARDPA